MDRETKKRTILARLNDLAERAFRRHGRNRLTSTTIQLHVTDLPAVLGLSFPELGRILSEVAQESHGTIRVGAVNGGSPRVRNNYLPVEVSHTAIANIVVQATRPTIVLRNRQWCIEIPGRRGLIPIARQGTLKGELLDVLASARFGRTQALDHVLEVLAESVTDRRTQSPTVQQIDNALREINETLHAQGLRRLRRVGERRREIGVVWKKQPIFSAAFVMKLYRGKIRVGFKVDPTPPKRR